MFTYLLILHSISFTRIASRPCVPRYELRQQPQLLLRESYQPTQSRQNIDGKNQIFRPSPATKLVEPAMRFPVLRLAPNPPFLRWPPDMQTITETSPSK